MFIQDSDLVELNIKYRKKNKRYEAYTENEFGKLKLSDEESKKFSIFTVKMRELTWGLFNQFQDESMTENSAGERIFNYRTYKELRLNNLIKEWDAKDDNGKIVPINKVNILKLSPSIAEAILRAYDEISLLDDEEEKK